MHARADCQDRFTALGKPERYIFEAGMKRLSVGPTEKVVMLGDQLITDIRGANAFGIDSVLVETGIGRPDEAQLRGIFPNHRLSGF